MPEYLMFPDGGGISQKCQQWGSEFIGSTVDVHQLIEYLEIPEKFVSRMFES